MTTAPKFDAQGSRILAEPCTCIILKTLRMHHAVSPRASESAA